MVTSRGDQNIMCLVMKQKISLKFQIMIFFSKFNMQHTIWTWLIGYVNMKWIRLILEIIQSGLDFAFRRTYPQLNQLATLSINLGTFFPVWLSGFVWLRPYARTPKTVSFGYLCP